MREREYSNRKSSRRDERGPPKSTLSPEIFVTCGQGLEPLLMEELTSLGFKDLKAGFRGVTVPLGSFSDIYRINYCSRLASRVLLPLMLFSCGGADDLYESTSKVSWTQFIKPGKTFAIDANVSHPNLRNSLYAAQVVKDAICDQYREKTGKRPTVELKNPDVQLNLFIRDSLAVLSFDTSGVPLHKRGYRQESVDAPVQESLAAAFLHIAGYRGEEGEVLCDPCCGSGTILIEAALIASRTQPGYLRRQWGFMEHPLYSSEEWLKIKKEMDQQRRPLPKNQFFGCDIGAGNVRVCKINLRAAGFQQDVEITQNDFREYTPSIAPTIVMTNPPHGKRLDDGGWGYLQPLYRALGDFLKQKTSKPSRGFIFTTNQELAKEVGLSSKQRHVIMSGGEEGRLLEFDVY